MKSRHVLVIADSCYSGSALRDQEGVPDELTGEERAVWLARAAQKGARRIITSGGTEPVLDNVGDGSNSVFAAELLRQLRRNDKVVTDQELFESLKVQVHSSAVRIRGSDAQFPENGPILTKGHDGGFFLFRPQDASVSLASLPQEPNPDLGIRGPGGDEDIPVLGSFRDCDTCPEMVLLPAGSFQMGSPSHERGRDNAESPLRNVEISRAFAVGKYEVTFAEWDACVADGGCNGYRPDDRGWGRGSRPVINVLWQDAIAYTQWLSHKTGWQYRLLSESEWEYAARAGTKTARPWGDNIVPGHANCDGCGNRWDDKQTAPAGSLAPNAFGLHDMLGNAWEWTADCWNDTYAKAPTDGSAWTTGYCDDRVLRGGAWYTGPDNVRSARRIASATRDRRNGYGFRVARTE